MDTVVIAVMAVIVVSVTVKSRAAWKLLPFLALIALLLVGAVALGLQPDLGWLTWAR